MYLINALYDFTLLQSKITLHKGSITSEKLAGQKMATFCTVTKQATMRVKGFISSSTVWVPLLCSRTQNCSKSVQCFCEAQSLGINYSLNRIVSLMIFYYNIGP